ncbi:MAG: type VI secretion system contractile sheath domain-containing protein [Gemmataceae bacterium]
MSDRLQLLYEAHGRVNRELPFVVGVLADLAGGRDDLPPLARRRFVPIDRDDFAEVLAKVAPELKLAGTTLRFRDLDDFGPAAVAAQVPALADLLHARRELHALSRGAPTATDVERVVRRLDPKREVTPPATPASVPAPPADGASLLAQMLGEPAPVAPELSDVDRLIQEAAASTPTVGRDTRDAIEHWTAVVEARLAAGLRGVLHDPTFQRLEATWLGLWQLVRNVETGPSLKIRVLNVRKAELLADQRRVGGFDQSELFRKVYSEVYEHADSEPIGLLLADFEFGPDDFADLAGVASVAEAAHAPLVAAAAPALLGVERFGELEEVTEPASRAWAEFRDRPASRYVALTVPRVLARKPYGKKFTEVEEFAFEELAGDGGPPWMIAAWAYGVLAAAAFERDGWFARTRGFDFGRVDHLLSFTTTIDGEPTPVGPAEVAWREGDAGRLADLGFLPLVAARDGDFGVFYSSRTCRRPNPDDAADDAMSQLHVLLGVSRLAQYLLVQSHHAGSSEQLTALLNDWLRRYPMLAGGVKVKPTGDRPGWLSIAAAVQLPGTPLLPLLVGIVRE